MEDQKKTLKVTMYHPEHAPGGQVHSFLPKPADRKAHMLNLRNLGWYSTPHYSMVMYHQTEARKGKTFKMSLDPEVRDNEVAELEAEGWVDTPAKLKTSSKAESDPAIPYMKHRGAGKWDVFKTDGSTAGELLSKDDAEALLNMLKSPE